RVSVTPAAGKAFFDEAPLPGAAIFLDPVGAKDFRFPRPQAIVKEDGSFVLGTYRKDDGAPPREKPVLVTWFPKAQINEDTSSQPPKNMLPARYAKSGTSGLTVKIETGKPELSPLKLTR